MEPLIPMLTSILSDLAASRQAVVEIQTMLVSHPAIAPESDGEGEAAKAAALKALLASYGFPAPRDMSAPDGRVPGGVRPNFSYLIPGQNTARTLWILAHLDVVPAGERSLWKTDPFALHVEGDALYGRGVEDNHQAIVCAALLGKALCARKIVPPINLGLLFLADEEVGNTYGLDYVARNHPDLFGQNDLILVPDCGMPDGLQIEIAEKSIIWLKVVVEGRQCHASMPELGANSLLASADFIMRLQELKTRFGQTDPLFMPPASTFEPTKKEANVDSVNMIPGRDVFYMDCRVLPTYDTDEVLRVIAEIGEGVARDHGVKITYETMHVMKAAPATSPDAEIVRRLASALVESGKGTPRVEGIGGGTFAAIPRRLGLAAAAWGTILKSAHQPNEKALISAQIGDAQIIARVLFGVNT